MKKVKLCRYVLFLAGLLLNGFGVAFITKAALGTTPIASIPYTLSLIVPRLSLGNFTILVSLLLILLQVLILRRRANLMQILLQIPVSFLFGYVIDFSTWMLRGFQPHDYLIEFISLLAGCVIIAFGAYFEVVADVVMLPADGFSRSISEVSGWKFGSVKLITDSSQAAIALFSGLIVLHQLAGVREGTIIGALLIGNLVKVIDRFWNLESVFQDKRSQA